jgi:hypothetical protein
MKILHQHISKLSLVLFFNLKKDPGFRDLFQPRRWMGVSIVISPLILAVWHCADHTLPRDLVISCHGSQ